MQKPVAIILFFVALFFLSTSTVAQDSAAITMQGLQQKVESKKDTSVKITFVDTLHKFVPSKATIRSAIIPGWGQAYNKQYWKIPIVYGALGTTAVIFFYNLSTYKKLRKAYTIRATNDTAAFGEIDPTLQPLSTESLQADRDTFRQNIDYSALFFIIFWGLNVADATVSAHLKQFDVTPTLSFRIKAGYSQMAGTNGLSLVFNFDKKHS